MTMPARPTVRAAPQASAPRLLGEVAAGLGVAVDADVFIVVIPFVTSLWLSDLVLAR
jgi:hypothetical protein